jgi:hypothetical protein
MLFVLDVCSFLLSTSLYLFDSKGNKKKTRIYHDNNQKNSHKIQGIFFGFDFCGIPSSDFVINFIE